MSNSNTVVRDDRELTLYLGTYWFDFEQATDLGNAVVDARRPANQNDECKPSEDRPFDYAI